VAIRNAAVQKTNYRFFAVRAAKIDLSDLKKNAFRRKIDLREGRRCGLETRCNSKRPHLHSNTAFGGYLFVRQQFSFCAAEPTEHASDNHLHRAQCGCRCDGSTMSNIRRDVGGAGEKFKGRVE
jgi:hypothetical protein